MKRTAYWGFSLLFVVALATPCWAQDIKDAKEYDAYITFFKETDHVKKAALGEKFLADFPSTVAKKETYQILLLAYANAGQAGAPGAWAKALDYAERVKEFIPSPDPVMVGTVNTIGFLSSQGTKNNAKTLDYGKKLLVANPNNLEVLVALSGILSSSFPSDPAARDAQINEALEITKRALAQPKPATANDAQWKQVQVQLLLTTCAMTYNKRQYPETVAACDQVLKLDKKNGAAWYYTGLALKYQIPEHDKRYRGAVDEYNKNRETADQVTLADMKSRSDGLLAILEGKVQEAIDAFAKSVAAGGVPEARAELEALYKGKNSGSLEGLDALIAQKKAELN
jgi:hypothetical protein